jgi:hypothetical protein
MQGTGLFPAHNTREDVSSSISSRLRYPRARSRLANVNLFASPGI